MKKKKLRIFLAVIIVIVLLGSVYPAYLGYLKVATMKISVNETKKNKQFTAGEALLAGGVRILRMTR